MLSSYKQETYYRNIKQAFPSFDVKYQEDIENTDNHQFCYAESWCFYVDFTTGRYSQCLRNEGLEHNFFEHLDEKLMVEPVGNRCRLPYCICGWIKTLNLIPGEIPVNSIIEIDTLEELQKIDKSYCDAE